MALGASSSPPLPGVTMPGQGDEVHVTLPCTPDHFAEFIVGLLGKPQTISRNYSILFEIDQNDIESLHHLIVQRVVQQNEASLTQFVAVISYDDDSTVRINSFDDFTHYSEVRPLRAVALNLTWIFLIRFQDRRNPEKQEINIRFVTPEQYIIRRQRRTTHVEIHYPNPEPEMGLIEAQVNYTARTWGNDIDGLLQGHLKGLERKDNPIFRFFHKRSGWLGLLLFFGILAIGVYATDIYTSRLDLATRSQIENLLDGDRKLEEIVIEVIRVFIAREFVLGERIPSFSVFVVGLLISLISAALLTALSAHTLDKLAKQSQIILTRQSKIRSEENQAAYNRKVLSFAAVQVLNIIVGLLVVVLGTFLPTDWIF